MVSVTPTAECLPLKNRSSDVTAVRASELPNFGADY
jgi:hypothetical protein